MSLLSVKHTKCPHCYAKSFVKRGYFYSKNTKTYIPRYNCKVCRKTFSTRTNSPTFMQKRTDLNVQIYHYLCSGASMRTTAKSLGCTYRTVYLKFLWLSQRAKQIHLSQIFSSQEIYFDEMQSIEHTKLKPLTVALAVDEQYRILGTQVGKIPAQGHLAKISLFKYGYRQNESTKKVKTLLTMVKSQQMSAAFTLKSDAKPEYVPAVRAVFKKVVYEQFSSRGNKEKRREQKYLKKEKKVFDPLFPLNQRCAKLRDHIKRLVRRSWCTNKRADHLELALYLYVAKNNNYKLI